jgi:tRNA A-37 threonylcarbamoyl transferase component Bud32
VVVRYQQRGLSAELALAEVRDAVPLEQAMARPDADRQGIVIRLAKFIGRLHRAGWTHGALASEHILVCPDDGTITFIDLEKAKRSRRRRGRDLERLWRHSPFFKPEERALFEAEYDAARR